MTASALIERPLSSNLHPSVKALASIGLKSRSEIEDLVEGLIGLLDRLDGDCDLEPDDFDCCEAYDDRTESLPLGCSDPHFPWAAGDPDDAEE